MKPIEKPHEHHVVQREIDRSAQPTPVEVRPSSSESDHLHAKPVIPATPRALPVDRTSAVEEPGAQDSRARSRIVAPVDHLVPRTATPAAPEQHHTATRSEPAAPPHHEARPAHVPTMPHADVGPTEHFIDSSRFRYHDGVHTYSPRWK